MPSDELSALTRLAFRELGGAAAGIGHIHRAVADRAFGASGPGGRPARAVHDALSRRVYGGLRSGADLAGRRAADLLGEREPISTSPSGSMALAALAGLIGDALDAEGSPLAEPMSVRVGGHAVELEPDAVARAFPQATGRLAVFVHGLMGNEVGWRLGGRPPYGTRLREDLDFTPVYVRYNSGLHISRNGANLDALLEDLVAAWPVAVAEVVLIGHSMGGLVSRSACHTAASRDAVWVRRVGRVISLGSPHMGAPLEQAAAVTSAALAKLPEARAFSDWLRRRSAGIRDLRQGSLVDEDWRDREPDALRAAACAEVPLLERATHYFVSATLTRSPNHPLGRLAGDILVLPPSARGESRKRRIPFRAEDGFHLGGASHFALLNHPKVEAQLLRWLAPAPLTAAAPLTR